MQPKLLDLLGACILLCAHFSGVLSLQCLDSNGNNVDWYMTYKLPKLNGRASWMLRDGVAHMYLDQTSPSWSMSKSPMNGSMHAVYNTLQQLYASKGNSSFFAMYNDEKPCGLRGGAGHTKGVLDFDKTSGFWLSHSTPKFPPKKRDDYTWPKSATCNGQIFLCISLSYSTLGQLGRQLLFDSPHVYDHYLPDEISRDYPVLKDLINGVNPIGPPYFSVVDLLSMGGQQFKNFAKSQKFEADLYEDLVSKKLKSDLFVESWMSGSGGKLPTNCSQTYKVFDVEEVSLPGNLSFHKGKDHSKWATSFSKDFSLKFSSEQKTSSSYWTCVGDINRMHSQWLRGGGTTCLQNAQVWKTFRASITKYQHC